MPRLKSSGEIIKILENNGFDFVSQNGSHGKFYSEKFKAVVIVPMNKREIPIGTFSSIISQSKLNRGIFE